MLKTLNLTSGLSQNFDLIIHFITLDLLKIQTHIQSYFQIKSQIFSDKGDPLKVKQRDTLHWYYIPKNEFAIQNFYLIQVLTLKDLRKAFNQYFK